MANHTLIRLSERRPEQALEALDRITGLRWKELPCSLMSQVREAEAKRKVGAGSQRKQAG